MNDNSNASSAFGEHAFPDDFARRVITQAHRERAQRRRRGMAATSLIILIALLPLNRVLQRTHGGATQADLAWQDYYSTKATELADATAPAQISDYLAPETARMTHWSGVYAEASWPDDSAWPSD